MTSGSRAPSGSRTWNKPGHLWRGSLLPLGCEAVVHPLTGFARRCAVADFRAASQPSGSKLPRHRGSGHPDRYGFSS
ncbi:hypothetical protein DCO47_23000 [Pseudomonas sp. NDM]|nr:hypothetical protein DCO47_23000 [Pseudomonas sp. NDM]